MAVVLTLPFTFSMPPEQGLALMVSVLVGGLSGGLMAGILTGSVVVEKVFGIPGIGQFFISGALNRDYTLVLGITIFYAALIIFLNLVVDLLYGFFDPRIRSR